MPTELKDTIQVEKILTGKKPTIIFFYMDGCPHCKNTMGPWKEVASKYAKQYTFAQVESQNVPSSLGIYAYPHFIIYKDGKRKEVAGSKTTTAELETALGFLSTAGKRTRRRRAHRGTRRRRQGRHGALSGYIALI